MAVCISEGRESMRRSKCFDSDTCPSEAIELIKYTSNSLELDRVHQALPFSNSGLWSAVSTETRVCPEPLYAPSLLSAGAPVDNISEPRGPTASYRNYRCVWRIGRFSNDPLRGQSL